MIRVSAVLLGAALMVTSAAGAAHANCAGVALVDMRDAGEVSKAAKKFTAYNCANSSKQEMTRDEVLGERVMSMGRGRLYAPNLGVWMDDLDVTASVKREVKTGCDKAGDFGSSTSAVAQGHGGC